MKKILFFLALVFLIQTTLHSQNYKFGKVSKEELQEKYYPTDSTANAAYLYSSRRTYYNFNKNKGFSIVNEYHQRIKIYNKEGFDEATRKIEYYKPDAGSKEKVSSITAVTYNLEKGKIVKSKASKKDIFDEQLSKYYSQEKITLPNIKKGSVIEIEYKLTSPFVTSIDQLEFQHHIPVKKLSCIIEIPEYFQFKKTGRGYYFITPEETTENRSVSWTIAPDRQDFNRSRDFENKKVDFRVDIQKYTAENIPALKGNEPYVNNISNYRGGLKYEIKYEKFPGSSPKYYSNSWADVAKSIYASSNFGGEINNTGFYKTDLANLVQGVANDGEKAMKIFQFVKQKIKWNGYTAIFPDKTLRKAYKEGTGNVAAINLMLTSMLREAGLDANPILVSTKSNGKPIFPTRNGFNYVVTGISMGKGTVLLDASEPYSLPNLLPGRALNWQGRKILKDGTSSWVNLTSGVSSIEENTVNIKIDSEGSIEGMMRNKFENLGALEYRNSYNNVKEEQLRSNLEEQYNIEIENFKVSNKLDLGKAIVRTIKFSTEDLIEEINGKMYIKPLLFYGYSTNPFKLKERKFPVEFSSRWEEKNTISIQIPEGYSVESSPETKALALPDNLGVFKYQVVSSGNKIKVISQLKFNSATISAGYYEILKGFFGEFVEKQNEKIILSKS
tara:strand:- start:17939 stop:19951 length:2013 start_codon:yes stop_codon:yes gene_type:complete